jgi:hypothetical protein
MARPNSSSLAEVLDRILDKGLVVDIWARVSVVGIEILTVEARIVAASVDTFLHYAENISKIEQASQSGDMEDLNNIDIEKPARPDNYQDAPTPSQ